MLFANEGVCGPPGAHLCFSPITERNSEGWQKASLTLRLTLRAIQPSSNGPMAKMFFSGICDAEDVV